MKLLAIEKKKMIFVTGQPKVPCICLLECGLLMRYILQKFCIRFRHVWFQNVHDAVLSWNYVTVEADEVRRIRLAEIRQVSVCECYMSGTCYVFAAFVTI